MQDPRFFLPKIESNIQLD